MPHNPRVSVVGNAITLTYTQAELPDCLCVTPTGEFNDLVITGPLTPGLYGVTVNILNCRDLFTAGSTEVLIPGSAATQLQLTSLPNPSRPNSTFVLTATVSGGGAVPTGLVEFASANCPQPCIVPVNPIGFSLLDSAGRAKFTWSRPIPGEYAFFATYKGDPTYSPSSGELAHFVSVNAPTIPTLDGPLLGLLAVSLIITAVLVLKRQGG